MSIRRRIKIDIFFDTINHLTQQRPRFHIVVSILKYRAHNLPLGRHPRRRRQSFQHRKQIIIDEINQLLTRNSFRILRSIRPPKPTRQRRFIIRNRQFPFLLLIIKNLQKQQPHNLTNALSVTIDTHILSHDVLNGFNESTDRHKSTLFQEQPF